MTEQELNQLVDERVAALAPKPPEQEQPAAKMYSDEELNAAVKTAQEEAVKTAVKKMEDKFIAAQRPAYGAPTVLKRAAEPKPVWWAVKAALMNPNASVILRDVDEGISFRAEGNDAAVKAFESYAKAARADVENGILYGVKAMNTTADTGGQFLPVTLGNRVIEALYEQVISRRLPGVDIYPMPGLVCDAPSIAAFTAGWTAENATATATDAATAKKTLTAKNLTALATLSNQLLNDSNPGIERYIRQGLAGAIGETHDTGAFNGSNSNNQPMGLLNESGPAATAISSDNVFVAVVKALGRMAVNKVPLTNTCVVMHPLVAVKALTTQVGSSGDFVGRIGRGGAGFVQNGNLGGLLSEALGVPVFTTSVLPVATGTASSTILVLHAPSWTIGDRQEIEIASSNVAGNAFAYNQTLIRAIMRVDFSLKRAAGLEKITGVTH